jgi:MFS family permease
MRLISAEVLAFFQQRNIVLFMLSRLFGNIGAQMQTVAVGWQVYAKTHSALDLGWIGLSQFAPFVLLILPAGYVADHFDRRRILLLCYVVQLLCAVALIGYTWSGLVPVWPIFLVMTVLGIVRAFSQPTSQSLLPNLVTHAHFSRAIAFNSMMYQTSTILGPTLAGLLLLVGLQPVYFSVVLCMLICIWSMYQLAYAHVGAADADSEFTLASLLSGLQFVRAQPLVLGAISLDLVAVLFGGATALLPIFASDILHVGPSGLGLLRAAPGVGALAAALWLSIYPIDRHVGGWLFGSVLVFGVSTLVFGASTQFWLSLTALVILGGSDMLSVFVRSYLVQLVTPDAIRGRVSSVNSVFIGASNELGEFESGITAAWWGGVMAVIVGGSATVVLTLLWMKLFPSLRRMGRFPQAAR